MLFCWSASPMLPPRSFQHPVRRQANATSLAGRLLDGAQVVPALWRLPLGCLEARSQLPAELATRVTAFRFVVRPCGNAFGAPCFRFSWNALLVSLGPGGGELECCWSLILWEGVLKNFGAVAAATCKTPNPDRPSQPSQHKPTKGSC